MTLKNCSCDKNGFSLVELIVALTIISIMTGILMRFFVISSVGEKIATELDYMSNIGQKTIEQFKSASTTDDFYNLLNEFGYVTKPIDAPVMDYVSYFTNEWIETDGSSGNQRYQMVTTIYAPSDELEGFTGGYGDDAEVNISNFGVLKLEYDEAFQRYVLSTTGSSPQYLTIAPEKEIIIVKLNLSGNSTNTDSIQFVNDLGNTSSSVPGYDQIHKDLLKVRIYRDVTNHSLVTASGNVVYVEETETATEKSGLYKIQVQFYDLNKDSALLGTFNGNKYGGVQ